MDTAKVIDKLNEILRWEWTGVVQYTQHSFLVQDLWREVFTDFFKEGAEESLGHARKIGEKIVALGGHPTVERGEVRQSADLHEMLTAQGVDTLIVTGLSTSHCIYATCRDATDSFRVIVPKEAVGERCEIFHEVNLLDIELDLGDVLPVDEVVRHLGARH